MPPRHPLALVTLAIALAVSAAHAHANQVTLCDGLVTITVPPGWQQVPPDVLELYALAMAEASGGLVTEVYQAALQPESAVELVQYPLILIQVKESGRLSHRPLLELGDLQEVARRTGADPSEPPGVRDLSLDQLFFDRTRCALRVSTTFTVEGAGRVGVHTASFLTERGRLVVHCLDWMESFALTAPLFDDVIRSVRVAPPLAYRPRLSDRWPWLSALDWRAAALAALILALLAALAVAVLRRR